MFTALSGWALRVAAPFLAAIPPWAWRLIGLLIAGLTLFLFGYSYANDKRDAKEAEEALAAVTADAVIVARRAEISETVAAETNEKVRTIYIKGKDITREIYVLIPADTPVWPGGFRLLHDAAAEGTGLPPPALRPNAAPVPAQEAANTIVDNYTECNAAIADLEGLRRWNREQAEVTK